MKFQIYNYGNPQADTLLIQMVDDHDIEVIEKEVSYIRELSGGQDFCLKAVKVNSWNQDLSPWQAPAVFGDEEFGEGASETLDTLLREVIPNELFDSYAGAGKDIIIADGAADSTPESDDAAAPILESDITAASIPEADSTAAAAGAKRKIYLGGYSLAGLFALWAGYQTDCFDRIAAASPSIWFPGFTDYMRSNTMRADAVYLSMGDREERTKHPIMSQVGNAIREGYALLQDAGIKCTLEWNKGNHFKNPDLRTAKAFTWIMNNNSGLNIYQN